MTAPASEKAILRLDQALRGIAPIISAHTAAIKATMPQFYTIDDLARRYCIGKAQAKALLEARGLYNPRPGVPVRVHLDDVLKLDKFLKDNQSSGGIHEAVHRDSKVG